MASTFHRDYENAPDREILIDIAGRVRGLEEKVDAIRCPSPRCHEHDRRITTVETALASADKHTERVIAWCAIVIAVVGAVIAAVSAAGGI